MLSRILALMLLYFTVYSPLAAQKKWPKVNLPAGNICQNEPYKLVFHDEFEGSALDTQKWITYYPYGPAEAPDSCAFCRTHVGNNIYRDSNVTLQNGLLMLKSDRQRGEWFGKTYDHTSGLVHSRQIFRTFGKYEIRCRLSEGRQQWPAFWIFGWNTEIDIFEFICGGPQILEFSIHKWQEEGCPNKNPQKGRPCFTSHSGRVNFGVDFSKDFHKFSVEYEPNMIKFYINDVMVRYVPRYYDLKGNPVTKCNIQAGEYRTDPAFPFDGQHVNLIANQLVCFKHKEKNPVFPNYMEVDYIRVYQKQIQSDLTALEEVLP